MQGLFSFLLSGNNSSKSDWEQATKNYLEVVTWLQDFYFQEYLCSHTCLKLNDIAIWLDRSFYVFTE